MSELDPACAVVLRATYQISGFTQSRVEFDQIVDVTSISMEQLRKIVEELRERRLIRIASDSDAIELTDEGLVEAERLPPVSEPPLFQDI